MKLAIIPGYYCKYAALIKSRMTEKGGIFRLDFTECRSSKISFHEWFAAVTRVAKTSDTISTHRLLSWYQDLPQAYFGYLRRFFSPVQLYIIKVYCNLVVVK